MSLADPNIISKASGVTKINSLVSVKSSILLVLLFVLTIEWFI